MAQLHDLQSVPILVLDDDPDSQRCSRFRLRTEGAVVSAIDCVAAAQTSFLAQPPQLVVSDLTKAGTTSYDLIAWLERLVRQPGAKTTL
jgi:CheY-like chemotaxis protein